MDIKKKVRERVLWLYAIFAGACTVAFFAQRRRIEILEKGYDDLKDRFYALRSIEIIRTGMPFQGDQRD